MNPIHCDEIQQALATGSVAPDLWDEIRVHLDACSDCREARLSFAHLDEVMSHVPAWEPPPGFAQSVAMRAAHLAQARPQSEPRQSSRLVGRILGFLSTAGYVAASLLAGIRVRIAGPAWVLRQYRALVVNTRN